MESLKSIVDEMVRKNAVFGATLDKGAFRDSAACFLRYLRIYSHECAVALEKFSEMYNIDVTKTYNLIKRDLLEMVREEVRQHFEIDDKSYFFITTQSGLGSEIVKGPS